MLVLHFSNPCPKVPTPFFGCWNCPQWKLKPIPSSVYPHSSSPPTTYPIDTKVIMNSKVFSFPISSNIRVTIDRFTITLYTTEKSTKITYHSLGNASWFRAVKIWKENVLFKSHRLQFYYLGKSQGMGNHKRFDFRKSCIWINKPSMPMDKSSETFQFPTKYFRP